jgi:hypothetical protein
VYIQEFQQYFYLVFCYYNKIKHKTSEMANVTECIFELKIIPSTHKIMQVLTTFLAKSSAWKILHLLVRTPKLQSINLIDLECL